jgi:hypothetical protein
MQPYIVDIASDRCPSGCSMQYSNSWLC